MRLLDYTYVEEITQPLRLGRINRLSGSNTFIIPTVELKGRQLYSLRSCITAPLIDIWDLVDDETEDVVAQAIVLSEAADHIASDRHLSVWNDNFKASALEETFSVCEDTESLLVCGLDHCASHYILKLGEQT